MSCLPTVTEMEALKMTTQNKNYFPSLLPYRVFDKVFVVPTVECVVGWVEEGGGEMYVLL